MSNHEQSLISVIVPVYLVEKYLDQCVRSLLNQTYRNLEIILVDDGSVDRSGSICDSYVKLDNRVQVFHNANAGLSGARNFGLTKAHGEWISFVDSDDWIEPEMIEILFANAKNTNADISCCGVFLDYVDSSFQRKPGSLKTYRKAEEIADGFFIEQTLSDAVWNKLFKRSFFDTTECFPVGKNYEDRYITTKIIKECDLVVRTSERLYHYRQRKNSIIHRDTIKNVIDLWDSKKFSYENLKFLPVRHQNYLLKNGIQAICYVWRALPGIDPAERKQFSGRLLEMSDFARKHFNEILRSNVEVYIKVEALIVQHCSMVSWCFLRWIYPLFLILYRRRNLQKQVKRLFD